MHGCVRSRGASTGTSPRAADRRPHLPETCRQRAAQYIAGLARRARLERSDPLRSSGRTISLPAGTMGLRQRRREREDLTSASARARRLLVISLCACRCKRAAIDRVARRPCSNAEINVSDLVSAAVFFEAALAPRSATRLVRVAGAGRCEGGRPKRLRARPSRPRSGPTVHLGSLHRLPPARAAHEAVPKRLERDRGSRRRERRPRALDPHLQGLTSRAGLA